MSTKKECGRGRGSGHTQKRSSPESQSFTNSLSTEGWGGWGHTSLQLQQTTHVSGPWPVLITCLERLFLPWSNQQTKEIKQKVVCTIISKQQTREIKQKVVCTIISNQQTREIKQKVVCTIISKQQTREIKQKVVCTIISNQQTRQIK